MNWWTISVAIFGLLNTIRTGPNQMTMKYVRHASDAVSIYFNNNKQKQKHNEEFISTSFCFFPKDKMRQLKSQRKKKNNNQLKPKLKEKAIYLLLSTASPHIPKNYDKLANCFETYVKQKWKDNGIDIKQINAVHHSTSIFITYY